MSRTNKSPKELFDLKYIVDPITNCWNWTACKDKNGYGRMTIKRIDRRAHRVSYEIHNGLEVGSISPDKLICHSCDNPGCVNPAHLFLGTPKDNTSDMIKKSRDTIIGVRNNGAKLTEVEVREIRELYANKNFNQDELAKLYGIGQTQVSRIVRKEKWKAVNT